MAISDEPRVAEEAAAATRRIQAARYALVHGEWFEDPGAIQPGEYLSAAASQEEIRRAYNRFGARFVVDADGELTLNLDLEEVGKSLQTERTFWTAATR